MKIKDDAEVLGSSDPYYDVIDGGYFNPEDYLEDTDDVVRVNEAIDLLTCYISDLQESGKMEEM